MQSLVNNNIILLTYKGKVLLTQKEIYSTLNAKQAWSFIIDNDKNEYSKTSVAYTLKKILGIKVDNVECLSKNCYAVELNDTNVNNIKRNHGNVFNFFSPNELNKLNLDNSTQQFLQKHSSKIQSN